MLLASGCSLFQRSKLVGYPDTVGLTGTTDPVEPPMQPVKPLPAPQPATPLPPPAAPVSSPVGETPSTRTSVPSRPAETDDMQAAPAPLPPRTVAAGEPTLRYRNATLSEDTRWSGIVLVEGGVTVAPQATLTIDPGTVVRFGESDDSDGTHSVLLVFGRLVVAGTQAQPVLLTSRYVEPRPADWQGIVIMGSEKRNSIEHCRIEGADAGIDAAFSSLTVKNTVLSNCRVGARYMDALVSISGGGPLKCGTGIDASDSELEMREGEVKGNRQGISAVRTSLSVASVMFAGNEREALAASASRVKILNSEFEMNGAGLHLSDTQGTLSYDRFVGNSDFGVSLQNCRLKVSGNEISSNGRSGLVVDRCNCAIWNNALLNNGTDLYNAGSGDVRAIGNWWGTGTPVEIEKRIFDRRRDPSRGRVVITPILPGNPLSP